MWSTLRSLHPERSSDPGVGAISLYGAWRNGYTVKVLSPGKVRLARPIRCRVACRHHPDTAFAVRNGLCGRQDTWKATDGIHSGNPRQKRLKTSCARSHTTPASYRSGVGRTIPYRIMARKTGTSPGHVCLIIFTSRNEACTDVFTPVARSSSTLLKISTTARGIIPASSGAPFTFRHEHSLMTKSRRHGRRERSCISRNCIRASTPDC